MFAEAPDPLKRRLINQPLELGVRVLDATLTCGEGQRMGIFAAAGGANPPSWACWSRARRWT